MAPKFEHDFKKVYKICLNLNNMKFSSPTLKINIRIIYFELYVHFIFRKVDVETKNKQ